MAFIADTDKRPVRFDSNGDVLVSGELKYYELDGTTPKSVYSDRALSVAILQPVLCGSDGRTTTQVFLSAGGYRVNVRRFIGDDVLTADPITDWAQDNQYDIDGLALDSGSTATITPINTIADLRAVSDPASVLHTSVQGYYTSNDLYPRSYHWDVTELRADNGGTVIRNPSISLGAWIWRPESSAIDVRAFGALPSVGSCNSLIQQAITWALTQTDTTQTIWFPAQTLEFVAGTISFSVPVIMDRLVYFKNDSSGNTVFEFDRGLTSDKIDGFTIPLSTYRIIPRFARTELNYEVDVRWWGVPQDNATDGGAEFEECMSNVVANNTVRIMRDVRLNGLTGNLSIIPTLKFVNYGQLNNNQSTYTITFSNDNPIISEQVATWGPFEDANLSYYIWNSTAPIRTSWFNSNGTTPNWGVVPSEISGNGTILIDSNINVTSSLLLDTGWIWEYEKGLMNIASSVIIEIYKSNFGGKAKFTGAGNVVLMSEPSRVSYFDGTNENKVIKCAYSAARGHGFGDFEGIDADMNSTAVLDCRSQANIELKNLRITATSPGLAVFRISGSPTSFKLSNITLDSLSYAGGTFVLFTSGNIPDMVIRDCQSLSAGSSIAFIMSGTVGNLRIDGCNFIGYASIASGDVSRFYARGNSIFGSALSLGDSECHIIGNTWNGSAASDTLSIGYNSTVSGNTFENAIIMCYSSAGVICPSISGNVIIASTTVNSKIVLVAAQENTVHHGTSIVGNTFRASVYLGSQIAAIQSDVDGVGNWNSTILTQFLCVSNNGDDLLNGLYAPCTKGAGFNCIVTVSGTSTAAHFKLSSNPYVFYVPGTVPIVRSFSFNFVAPQTGITSIDMTHSYTKNTFDSDGLGSYQLLLSLTRNPVDGDYIALCNFDFY